MQLLFAVSAIAAWPSGVAPFSRSTPLCEPPHEPNLIPTVQVAPAARSPSQVVVVTVNAEPTSIVALPVKWIGRSAVTRSVLVSPVPRSIRDWMLCSEPSVSCSSSWRFSPARASSVAPNATVLPSPEMTGLQELSRFPKPQGR